MANQELVQYIKQQIQLREAQSRIEEILLGAGWTKEDITEAMAVASPAQKPTVQAVAPAQRVMPVQQVTAKPVSVSFNAVSGFKPVAMVSKLQTTTAKPQAATFDVNKVMSGGPAVATNSVVSFQPATKPGVSLVSPSSHKGWIWGVLGAVVGLVLAAVAVYFYMNSSDVATALQKSKNEASGFQMQVRALTGQVSDLQTQVSGLQTDNADFTMQAEFFTSTAITPVGATSSAGIISQNREARIKGVLTSQKGIYTLTTSKGIVITVKNSKDAKVDAVLKLQIGNTVELMGTHATGSADITVVSVNGLAL